MHPKIRFITRIVNKLLLGIQKDMKIQIRWSPAVCVKKGENFLFWNKHKSLQPLPKIDFSKTSNILVKYVGTIRYICTIIASADEPVRSNKNVKS